MSSPNCARRGRKRKQSDIIDLSIDNAQFIAAQVASQKTSKKTRKIYASKLNKWMEFYNHHFPHVLIRDDNNENIDIDVNQLSVEHINSFLGTLSRDSIEIQNSDIQAGTTEFVDLLEDKTIPAYQTVSGHVSALKNAFRDQNIDFPQPIRKVTDNFLDGYKKIIADLKQNGKYAIEEGKKHIKFEGYVEVIRLFSQYSPSNSISYLRGAFQIGIFCILYMVLCWNMAQRSETVGNIHLEHIKWTGDSMCFKLPRTKNDQAGEKDDADDDGKHVYANPQNPLICPVSNFAIYFWTIPRTTNKLFQGDSQQSRYGTQLRTLLANLLKCKAVSALLLICRAITDIGTHSFRKGAATYALSFFGFYQLSDVYLRVGWSLGNVQDRYIFQTPGGDQCLGRTLCGLSPNSENFAMLPPHFDRADINMLTLDDWCALCPDYVTLPDSFKGVLPFLLASLYFHEEYYRRTLPANHLLFLSPPFQCSRHNIVRLKTRIYCEVNQCLQTGLIATGVPMIMQLSIRLNRMEAKLDSRDTQLIAQLNDLRKDLPQLTSEFLRANNQVQGSEVQRVSYYIYYHYITY